MRKILVVDDSVTTTELTKFTIEQVGEYQVRCAHSGVEALEVADKWQPDLITLDDQMPDLRGCEVARRLRLLGNNVPILMITCVLPGEVGKEEKREIQCLQIGCDDFLFKPVKPSVLHARIQALLRRKGEMAQFAPHFEVLNYADIEVNGSAHTARRGSHQLNLTLREYQLLTLFLKHPRQVLERGLILDRVWGWDYEGVSNVVEVYIGYLRTKLEECGGTRLIQTIRGVGYVLRELDESL